MDMETIKVEVSWSNKNFSGGWGLPGVGALVVTAKTLDEFKKEFKDALDFHIDSMIEDGDNVPKWLVDQDYIIEFDLAVSALLREAERFTTMAVISRFTGINQKLLSHYANAVKIPREAQRERIVNGLHAIGQQILAVH